MCAACCFVCKKCCCDGSNDQPPPAQHTVIVHQPVADPNNGQWQQPPIYDPNQQGQWQGNGYHPQQVPGGYPQQIPGGYPPPQQYGPPGWNGMPQPHGQTWDQNQGYPPQAPPPRY